LGEKSVEAAKNSKDIIFEITKLKNKMGELNTPQGRYTIVSKLQSFHFRSNALAIPSYP
jgi:hypothetical protein